MRIAFFGGSFDPPHSGHLRIASAAAERLQLDRILLAPVALQPLKQDAVPPAAYLDRLAMLRLLLASQQQSAHVALEVSTLDAPRPDGLPNYTVDTLQRLRSELSPADELFLLIGADSFLNIRQWHRAPDLLLLASSIIAARPGFPLDRLEQALPPSIRPGGSLLPLPGRHQDCLAQTLTGPAGQSTTLYLLPDLSEDVSATGIRAAFASGADLPLNMRRVLPQAILDYIRAHRLYR